MEPAASAPGVVPDAKGTDEPRDPSPGSRTDSQLWIEVIAVLCLGYLPNLFSALSSLFERNPVRHSFVNEELSRIVMALAISAPLLVIMALGRDPWSVFGIVRPRWLMDALAGGMILVVAFVAGIWGAGVLPPTDNSIAAPMQRPEGVAAICLLAVSCTAGAFAEELVMRGYLIPRLARLLRSTWMAVVASTVLFASYHIYQGLASMVGVAAMGLVYAVSFCLLRRLWPVCAAHSIHNFLVFL
jgi:membrane protease YdiL (CAAX protease family)